MSSKSITKLEIQALKKFLETVPPEKREEVLKNFPDSRITETYNMVMRDHQKTIEYRFIQNLIQNSKQCKSDNLQNLTKKQLIKCLFRHYPLDEIKKKGGMQYLQFLSLFFNVILFGYPTYYRGIKNRTITNNYSMDLGTITSPPINDDEPYNTLQVYVPLLPTISKREETKLKRLFTHSLFVVLSSARFTINQLIEMVNILFPKFPILFPNEWRGLLNSIAPDLPIEINPEERVPSAHDTTLSIEKLIRFLLYIGKKLSLGGEEELQSYTPQEIEFFGTNFRFSTSQIEKFLNVFTREQYIKILTLINNTFKPYLLRKLTN